MSAAATKILVTGSFFLFIFLFGFLLSRTGKPYPPLLFNVHKLIALGALVFLAMTVYNTHRAMALTSAQIGLVVFTGLCFVVTIVAGGLLNIDKSPAFLAIIHRVSPYLTLLSTAGTLYLLLERLQ
jgi:drug/metabolite transporter (DMT)-like permease